MDYDPATDYQRNVDSTLESIAKIESDQKKRLQGLMRRRRSDLAMQETRTEKEDAEAARIDCMLARWDIDSGDYSNALITMVSATSFIAQLANKPIAIIKASTHDNSLRGIMTKQVRAYGWCDYAFKRGDNDAKSFKTYEDWLNSLDDDDFLAAYIRAKERSDDLD